MRNEKISIKISNLILINISILHHGDFLYPVYYAPVVVVVVLWFQLLAFLWSLLVQHWCYFEVQQLCESFSYLKNNKE